VRPSLARSRCAFGSCRAPQWRYGSREAARRPWAIGRCGTLPHSNRARPPEPCHNVPNRVPPVQLERFEVASARRRRLQRAVRRAVDAPPDGNGLPVQESVPVAVAHGRVRHLLKPDARGVAARMDPPPVRRERCGVGGHGTASGADSAGRHRGCPANVGHRPGRNEISFTVTASGPGWSDRQTADGTSSPYCPRAQHHGGVHHVVGEGLPFDVATGASLAPLARACSLPSRRRRRSVTGSVIGVTSGPGGWTLGG
jgi:hypothetical protein